MRVERKVTVGDREVTVRELTIGEIRQWIAAAEQMPEPSPEVLATLALLEDPEDHLALLGVERMTDFTLAAVDSLPPSALHALLTACREVNHDFFGMLARATATSRVSG